MVCKNCGKKIKKNAIFCENCGARTEEEEKEGGAVTGKQKIMIGALSAVILALLCAVIAIPFMYKRSFRSELKQFQEIEDVYSLGDYEDSYRQYLSDGQAILDQNAFFAIKEQKSRMRELKKQIMDFNDKNMEMFIEAFGEFEKTETDYKLGKYEAEYKKKLEEAAQMKERPDYKKAADMRAELLSLRDTIKEMNAAMEEYQAVYRDAETALGLLYIGDDEKDKYQSLLDGLDQAIGEFDAEACEKQSDRLLELKDAVEKDNRAALAEKTKLYKDTGSLDLYVAERQLVREAYKKALSFSDKGDYLHALEQFQVCDDITDISSQSGSYDFFLEQVDVTDYPKVKLYFSASSGDDSIEGLDGEKFTLMESADGGNSYEKINVVKASCMDGKENLNVALVADCSASMENYGISYAQSAMKNFTDSLQVDAGDKAAVYSFADDVNREQGFTSDRQDLKNAIDGIGMGDMTALYDALAFSLSEIEVQSGAKCIIAFTDGINNYSQTPREYIISKAQEYKVPIYLIGIGNEVNSSDLQYIALQTGGFYRNISDLYSMQEVYDSIYRKQKSMYVVEYKTTEKIASDVTRFIYVNYWDTNYGLCLENVYRPSNYKINNFIFFDSDQRYLTEAELEQLTEAEVRIALNEIYARRGYIFKKAPDLKLHFENCSWYHGTEENMSVVASKFNQYEQKNADLLVNYECRHKLNGRVK